MELDDDTGFEALEEISGPVEASEGPESIEESIAAAFEEVDAKAAQAKSVDSGETTEEKPVDEKPKSELSEAASRLAKARKTKGPKQVVEAASLDVPGKPAKTETPTILPPDDWDVKLKEEFNALHPSLKQRNLDFWNGMKANATKGLQEISRHREEAAELKSRYSELNEIADFYAPRWGLKGQTVGQVARELFAAQEVILQDPELAIATLIKKNNANYDRINAYLEGHQPAPRQQATPQQQYQSSQVQNQSLTKEDILATYRELREQEQRETQVSAGKAEIETLKHQTSADGRTYLYPELHSQDDIERLKPLVDNIRKTQPGVSWADATIRAIQADRFALGRLQSSPSPNVTRLPNQQEIQRARQASVSVRGRGNAAIPSVSRAKPGETVEESLQAVWGGTNQAY